MNTAIEKRTFEGHEIEFDSDNRNIMVNATEMARIYGKRIQFFLKSKQTKEFILALKGKPNGAPLAKNFNSSKFTPNGVNLDENNGNDKLYQNWYNLEDSDIIQTKGRNGTWMHRMLALKFAAWLNPIFEVWVYRTIEDILFNKKKREEVRLLRPHKEFIPYLIPHELVYNGKATADEMSKDLMRRVLDIAEYYNIKTGNVNGWLFRRA